MFKSQNLGTPSKNILVFHTFANARALNSHCVFRVPVRTLPPVVPFVGNKELHLFGTKKSYIYNTQHSVLEQKTELSSLLLLLYVFMHQLLSQSQKEHNSRFSMSQTILSCPNLYKKVTNIYIPNKYYSINHRIYFYSKSI